MLKQVIWKFKKLFWKICNMITYFFISFAILWVCYIFTMALWNTFCKGCPNAWYQENIHTHTYQEDN